MLSRKFNREVLSNSHTQNLCTYASLLNFPFLVFFEPLKPGENDLEKNYAGRERENEIVFSSLMFS